MPSLVAGHYTNRPLLVILIEDTKYYTTLLFYINLLRFYSQTGTLGCQSLYNVIRRETIHLLQALLFSQPTFANFLAASSQFA
jgi:hypothetical protein